MITLIFVRLSMRYTPLSLSFRFNISRDAILEVKRIEEPNEDPYWMASIMVDALDDLEDFRTLLDETPEVFSYTIT